MARFNPFLNSEPVYVAAGTWRELCLFNDGSVLRPGLGLWTLNLADELDRRFVKNLDEGEGAFLEKLRGQLAEGSSDCRQLMAEVLWILMLFQSNVGADKKRENVREIWSWSGEELQDDQALLTDDILGGLASTGAGFNTHRWREIAFLIGAVRDLKARSPGDREEILSQEWSFAEWLFKLDGAKNRQLPHILTHLLFPDAFERISSPGEKRAILIAFENIPKKELKKWEPIAIDRRLLELRQRLRDERGGDFDFYEPELTKVWRDSIATWLLTWNPGVWNWSTLRDDREKTRAGQTVTLPWRCASTAPREGDHVYLMRLGVEPKGVVGVGTVSRASYDSPHFDSAKAAAGEKMRRIDVDFSDVRDVTSDPILELEVLQGEVPDQNWTPQSSGIEIKQKAASRIAHLWSTLTVPQELSEAAKEENSNRQVDTTEPLNLILYGPPGTGKTHRLRHHYIPLYMDAGVRRFELVTFHQSYAYEDFVEGIRPTTDGGKIGYEVRPGVLRRLCARARKDPGHRYALFIDEINRGNVAKIFGELITLVERDKRLRIAADGEILDGLEVTLPYSGDLFGIPSNVDLIGTMNTADRSIALLDTALRRRFRFDEMMPIPGSIKGVRDGVIDDDQGGEINLRRLLETINDRLEHLLHRDQTIGHAYFTEVRNFADLRKVIARELLPLLQEYFYDDWRQMRLVLADDSVEPELQIVRQRSLAVEELFPEADETEIGESRHFDIVRETEIFPDAIRKIYEPRQ